jgi:hypothetical protein
VVINLTANLFVFLLLPGKVYADVINGLQYGIAKMQTKSEMYAKYGHEIYF